MDSDFTLTNPIDHTLNPTWPEQMRALKYLILSRLYYTADEPTVRPDGAAFTEEDNGSFWIDSDDNKIHILTDYSGPTWTDFETTIEAMTLVMASADCTLTLQNTDEENTDGGRQVKFIAKGEQDGTEVTTLGYIEFSHEGSSDDEKGQCRVFLNDGDDGNAPTLVMTIPSTGVPPTMVESTAPAADAQLANKKYVDDQITAHKWTHDGTQVFNTDAPTSFTDLDLSSYCGSNRALVFLKIKNADASQSTAYHFRTNGDTENIGSGGVDAGGCSLVAIDTGNIGYVTIETDASGIVEWSNDNAGVDTDVWIAGYIKS